MERQARGRQSSTSRKGPPSAVPPTPAWILEQRMPAEHQRSRGIQVGASVTARRSRRARGRSHDRTSQHARSRSGRREDRSSQHTQGSASRASSVNSWYTAPKDLHESQSPIVVLHNYHHHLHLRDQFKDRPLTGFRKDNLINSFINPFNKCTRLRDLRKGHLPPSKELRYQELLQDPGIYQQHPIRL